MKFHSIEFKALRVAVNPNKYIVNHISRTLRVSEVEVREKTGFFRGYSFLSSMHDSAFELLTLRIKSDSYKA